MRATKLVRWGSVCQYENDDEWPIFIDELDIPSTNHYVHEVQYRRGFRRHLARQTPCSGGF